MPLATREDTWLIDVTLYPVGAAPLKLGVFDTFAGGETDSEEAKYRPGNMGIEISLGGSKTVGNVTVGRYLDVQRDWPVYKTIQNMAGSARMSVARTPLLPSGMKGGDAATWIGTLKTATLTDVDSTGSDVAKLELEMTCDASVA